MRKDTLKIEKLQLRHSLTWATNTVWMAQVRQFLTSREVCKTNQLEKHAFYLWKDNSVWNQGWGRQGDERKGDRELPSLT